MTTGKTKIQNGILIYAPVNMQIIVQGHKNYLSKVGDSFPKPFELLIARKHALDAHGNRSSETSSAGSHCRRPVRRHGSLCTQTTRTRQRAIRLAH